MAKLTHGLYLVVIAFLVSALFHYSRAPSEADWAGIDSNLNPRIAILPFYSDSPFGISFAASLTSSLNANLSERSELELVSIPDDRLGEISSISDEYMLAYVLEGAVSERRDLLQVTVQFIDRNDQHVWAQSFNIKSEELEGLTGIISDRIILTTRKQ